MLFGGVAGDGEPCTKATMNDHSKQSNNLSGSSVGRFQIRERLGSGGMGEVYLADDPQLKRTVAIKRMSVRLVGDEHHRQRFLREAQMASRLNDSHIAAIYDVLEREGEIFLVMEYVEGKTLRHLAKGPIQLEEFLPIAAQCAQALAVAHGQGVLHRDIKPDNIMVTPSGQVKILDFGLARRLTAEEETEAFETEPGAISGTAGYIAPEVLVGREPDERGDIFSLGVVFYEALTGEHPFRGQTNIATSSRVLHVDPPPPTSVNAAVPPELDRVVMRMLEKAPTARYQTAKELADELDWMARSGTTPTIVGLPIQEAPAARGSRRRLVLISAVAAVAAIALLAAIPQVRRTVGGWMGAGPSPATSPAASPAATNERQVAVLPFTVPGGTPAQQAFAAGLTDTVTARLAQLSATHSLSVVPANLMFSKKVDSADAARREFGVNLVLTGSLQQAGNQIRVTYALVDSRTQRQLSANTETVAAKNPFAVEDEVAVGVLDMLKVQLDPSERKTYEAKGTDKPDAYAFYLQGMGYLENYTREENIASAIEVFQHALDIDPRYAHAYAGLGRAYWQRYVLSNDAKWTAPSLEACKRSLALDPNLAGAHVCLGTVASGTGKYQEAVEQFQKALAIRPTDDRAYQGLADAYGKLGRTAEAEQTFQKAIRLRPQYWSGYNALGFFYYQHGRYEDAVRMFQHVVALAPDSFQGYSNLGAIYVLMGDFAKAVPVLQHSIGIRPTGSAYTNLATALYYQRHYDEAVANFEKAAEIDPRNYVTWRNVGDGYYWARGRREQADAAYQKGINLTQDALRVNPNDADAYKILAACQAMLGAKQQAIAAITRALTLAPSDPDSMYVAAVVYTQVGEKEQGIVWLKKALAAGFSAAMARNDPAFDSLRGMKDFPRSLDN
jgi:tetratricopeptide (TPR) repeat protein/TolB-like protein/tRNA A-37 threonylcarbamoyl transferase component Bud32